MYLVNKTSLGWSVKKINGFNDLTETRDLAEIIKQGFCQDHKTDNGLL